MKVYRLGPPLPPTFHRDPPTPTVEEYFKEGAFYAVGTLELVNAWKTMSDAFSTRPMFEVEIKDTSVVMFFQGWSEKEKIAIDLTETVYGDWGDGPQIDPEECQLVIKLSDILSFKEIL